MSASNEKLSTPKEEKTMSIRLSLADQDAIARIKQRYGIRHDVEAIRLALRLIAMDDLKRNG